ncbi:hypothetical protein O2K51_07280 [Apibacter raozihei]|uniref:hypothetical protein n=1 Tax=Apibacter raozihei TaxID=2500547 RepID=UPI000FE31F90
MELMKPLILVNLFFFSILLQGQSDSLKNNDLVDFTTIKSKIFQNIILSKELENDTQCKMIVIPSLSLGVKKKYEYLEPYKKKDSLTLNIIRNVLPPNYWVYQKDNEFEYINKGSDLIDYYIDSDSIYAHNKLLENRERKLFTSDKGFYYYHCNDEFDIIKIYEPFDKWADLYFNSNVIKIVIPVKYEHVERFNIKEKYFLYKVELYENGTDIKSVKLE